MFFLLNSTVPLLLPIAAVALCAPHFTFAKLLYFCVSFACIYSVTSLSLTDAFAKVYSHVLYWYAFRYFMDGLFILSSANLKRMGDHYGCNIPPPPSHTHTLPFAPFYFSHSLVFFNWMERKLNLSLWFDFLTIFCFCSRWIFYQRCDKQKGYIFPDIESPPPSSLIPSRLF